MIDVGAVMDFSLSEEQAALKATARRFAEAELTEAAEAAERDDEPPGPGIVARFAEMGFLGINLDPAFGGQGAGHLEAVLVLEEIAKISPAVAFPVFESCFGPVLAIQHFSDRSLKERLSPHCPEIQGCIRCGVCIETPNPDYALPEKWKELGTSPYYLKLTAPTV